MTNKKPLNLLTDPWLPVRCKDRSVVKIKIAEIGRNDIVDIVSPRADFRGAIYQLLIGVLQTMFAPAGQKEWLKYWYNTAGKEELQTVFAAHIAAFETETPVGTPAFMQDLGLSQGKDKHIAAMLIESPGDKTQKDNQDLFIKRGRVDVLSPSVAALALFTLQINAPSGGVGHRVSLRGGGPLTTLILPSKGCKDNTLWKKLWLNVLTQEDIAKLPGNAELASSGAIFPWMAPTRTSEKKGMETFPEHGHALQAYWSMPRRIRLNFSAEESICDLTGEPENTSIVSFYTKNYGVNYAGNWVHPLTPYVFEQGEEPRSVKAQPGGLGYRHWPGLVVEGKQGKQSRSPATVVQCYKQKQSWIKSTGDADFNPRLWAFGFDMDNMKARCWYEAQMPVFNLDQEEREDIAEYAQKMIAAATDALKTLKSALKKAWFKRPGDVKGDMTFVDANFWSATEPDFYSLLQRLVDTLDNEIEINKLLDSWRKTLKHEATVLFDQYALSSLNEDGDLKRIIMAREGKGGLQHYLNGSKAIKALVA